MLCHLILLLRNTFDSDENDEDSDDEYRVGK